MATFREFVQICSIYILLNQVTNQYAFSIFNFGQALFKRKVPPQESNFHLNEAPSNLPVLYQNKELSLYRNQPHLNELQISHHDPEPNALHQNNHVNHPRSANNLPVLHNQNNNDEKLDHRNPQSFYHQQNAREYAQKPNDQFKFHQKGDFDNEARVFNDKRPEARRPQAKRPYGDFANDARAPRARRPRQDFVNEARAPRAKRPQDGFVNQARAARAKRPQQDLNQPIFDHYEYIGDHGVYNYYNNDPPTRYNRPPQFRHAPNQDLRNNMRPRNDPIYQKRQKMHPNAENYIRRAPSAGQQRSRMNGMRNQYAKPDMNYDQVAWIRQRGNFNPQNPQFENRARQPMNSARQNIRHMDVLRDAPRQRPRPQDPHVIYDQAGRIRQRVNFEPQNQPLRDRIRQPVNSARGNMQYMHMVRKPNAYEFQDDYQERPINRKIDERPGYWSNWNGDRVSAEPANLFAAGQQFQPIHQEAFDGNFNPRRQFDYITPLDHDIPRDEFRNQDDGIRTQKTTFAGEKRTLGGERPTLGGPRQTYKHFRYSRIRRYYTLSTASMTTWKRLNYTTRLMYTTSTTATQAPPRRYYTDPHWGGSSRQTVLHTRMTESDEVGKDLFVSGSIEYKDDSFDKPPTAMVAYDSLQMELAKNASSLVTPIVAPVTTPTKPTTTMTTKKPASIELISLESSSEEKPSSSEAKEEESSPESEYIANEKLYGEYGYYRKYNYTPTPIVIDTYANLREVPGFSSENLTSAEVAFWQANASWIMDRFFPEKDFPVILSNYSEENLVRSFFLPENIDPQHLDFYKWYYKLLTNPERLRTIYNRTVLEEPDYKNLSQYTPFVIPEDLQRYYMFINQMEIEMEREKKQEEYLIKNEREAEQNIDKILGVAAPAPGRGARPSAGAAPAKIPRLSRKDDPDVSQILEMIDNRQSDSLMREDDSSDGFIDASRYKREVSNFDPD